ncbi:MAG: Rrf2 family transcriptional regulator [Flavobacterium sp.]|nr:MAG: Rrf2 family transcriptional regulator [Flavobacterium sp.]
MLSNASKYAVKAINHLVLNSSEENKLLVKDIAELLDIPKPFLSKILQQLSAGNYISSAKGPGGGFFVTSEQLDGSILDIIVETEGKDRFKQCALNFDDCNESKPCAIHHLIATMKDGLRKAYKDIRLKDLKSEN